MGALEVITNLVKILASPGGLAALDRLFGEGGITVEKTAKILKDLPPPVHLPGDGD